MAASLLRACMLVPHGANSAHWERMMESEFSLPFGILSYEIICSFALDDQAEVSDFDWLRSQFLARLWKSGTCETIGSGSHDRKPWFNWICIEGLVLLALGFPVSSNLSRYRGTPIFGNTHIAFRMLVFLEVMVLLTSRTATGGSGRRLADSKIYSDMQCCFQRKWLF